MRSSAFFDNWKMMSIGEGTTTDGSRPKQPVRPPVSEPSLRVPCFGSPADIDHPQNNQLMHTTERKKTLRACLAFFEWLRPEAAGCVGRQGSPPCGPCVGRQESPPCGPRACSAGRRASPATGLRTPARDASGSRCHVAWQVAPQRGVRRSGDGGPPAGNCPPAPSAGRQQRACWRREGGAHCSQPTPLV